jgi:hypothetical protein
VTWPNPDICHGTAVIPGYAIGLSGSLAFLLRLRYGAPGDCPTRT